MELLREFGDPKDLLLAQDHIMLKLETAWPPDVTVPGGLSFADHDSLLLIANQTSLVSAAKSSLLREAIIPKALFCGCAPFDSSDRYASAARQLLRHAQEICILHNRDKVYKLIRMFPNVKVLCLPHDLCLHLLELDEPCRDRSAPLVERCQLRELVGNIGSLCKGLLGMSPETTLAVIRTCPDVVVESLDTLAKISAFCNLRSLTVELNPCIALADVDSELQHALRRLSRLEELALENCGGLRLSTISRLCPKLKILKLEGCVVSAEDTLVDGDAFPNLEYIDVNINILKVAWNAFLSATHDTLRTARFVHDSMCFEFLQYCVRYGRHQPFSRLEHLTLNTNMSLRESEVHPEDLHDVMKALPVLRHLETDSYDLRLFMENYCVPRGRLSLSWIECVYCAVHRPDLALFEKMLASAMGSLVYRQ
ncbi:hypothetical protein HPB49_020918 [Dermacentor silvarum]|uniref:Uncharacterized protein n=1 Tax=Dermacentor silvarum TaxID=543639 RepID=A0ACB8C5C4_DERSI|nr:hypothetical protein HPB49_020918 [Dermacentor silvarum]